MTGPVRWLSVAQAAYRLRLTPETVRYHIRAGTLPAIRAGNGRGIYRVTEQAVEEFLARRSS